MNIYKQEDGKIIVDLENAHIITNKNFRSSLNCDEIIVTMGNFYFGNEDEYDLTKITKKDNESQFKQGDKVLVSNDNQEWYERIFVVKHNNLYQCEPLHENISNILTPWKHIKPYEEEIKVGDWVISENRNHIYKVTTEQSAFKKWAKITDEVLINKLNEL